MGIVPTDEEGKQGPVLRTGVESSLTGGAMILREEGTLSSLWSSVRDVFFPEKLPPLVLESKPIPVIDRMATRQDPKATASAIIIEALLLVLFIMWGANKFHQMQLKKQMDLTNVLTPPPMPPDKSKMGGGGGQKSPTPVSKGQLPKFAQQQITPPKAPPMEQPKIRMPDPTIEVQTNLKMANNNMPTFGDPRSTLSGNSMGNGRGTGIGSGNGSGFGDGTGGNFGGGLRQIGGGVSAPRLVYKVEAEFSEEARKAKFMGVVTVNIVIDENGKPRNVRVVRGVGMGLDQKAIEAVQQYKFKPAMEKGKPVAVAMNIEVDFQIF